MCLLVNVCTCVVCVFLYAQDSAFISECVCVCVGGGGGVHVYVCEGCEFFLVLLFLYTFV